MKLEVGKYYKTRGGRKVGPMRLGYGIEGFYWDCGRHTTFQFYKDDGVSDDGTEYDLISACDVLGQLIDAMPSE